MGIAVSGSFIQRVCSSVSLVSNNGLSTTHAAQRQVGEPTARGALLHQRTPRRHGPHPYQRAEGPIK